MAETNLLVTKTPGQSTTLVRGDSLTSSPTELQWQVPETLKTPPDQLKARLDFYSNSIMLYTLENHVITAQHVSADDVAASLLSVANLFTGLLPKGTLWYIRKELTTEMAIYQPPKIRKVAVVTKPLEPPERFTIPIPGLIFICTSGQPPRVFASKSRPESMECPIYNAPFFNVYHDGRTCAGTNKYPENVAEIPDNFFMCFFSLATFTRSSASHPDSLYALWQELDGKKEYPMDDLVSWGKLKEAV